jgi:hypothetical protein
LDATSSLDLSDAKSTDPLPVDGPVLKPGDSGVIRDADESTTPHANDEARWRIKEDGTPGYQVLDGCSRAQVGDAGSQVLQEWPIEHVGRHRVIFAYRP